MLFKRLIIETIFSMGEGVCMYSNIITVKSVEPQYR